MKGNEMPEDSSAFKTISSYQEQNKVQKYHVPHQRKGHQRKYNSQDIEYLRSSLTYLQDKRKKLVQGKKYKQLSKTQTNIKSIKKQLHKGELDVMSHEHKLQQSYIYEAHLTEMKEFRQVWQQIFLNFNIKKQEMVTKLRSQYQKDTQKAEDILNMKASKVRPYSYKLTDLNKMQNTLMENKRYQQLIRLNVGHMRKDLKKQIKKERKKQITRLQEREEAKLNKQYQLKHKTMNMKIEEGRKYIEKMYQKQQKRLKQKFDNILSKVKHKQTMEKQKHMSSIS